MKIILIYASQTGNTQEMAEAVEEGIRSAGAELTVKEVTDAKGQELEAYDGIVLGAYTWGDGELPDEFLDFYDEMDGCCLTGKQAAVFGSCDSAYSEYGAAVDLLRSKLLELGAAVPQDGLKVELSPSSKDKKTCVQFGVDFVRALSASGGQ